jgi:hypothetical protein
MIGRWRLPRFCLLHSFSVNTRRSHRSFPGQIIPCQTLVENLRGREVEAVEVAHIFAVVEAEGLLVKVAKKVKGFDAYIRAAQTTLQETPVVFQTVRVNLSADVFDRVIHDLMRVVLGESFVGQQRVGVKGSARFNMLLDFLLKRGLLAVGYYGRADLAPALQNAHNRDLVFGARPGDPQFAFGDVHVAGLAADECLIGLDVSRQLIE